MPHFTAQMAHVNEHHRIVIVGGGLAGVSTAIALSLAGVRDILILESAPQLSEVGAGIQITPNASRILMNWGLEEALSKTAVRPGECRLRRWSNGRALTKFSITPGFQSKFGAVYWNFHRADLHEVLIQRALSLGVQIRCSCKVHDVIFDQGIVVTDGHGSIKAQLIIAADGLYSTCRSRMPRPSRSPLNTTPPPPDIPRPTGDVAYRVVLHRDQLEQDPELMELVTNPNVDFWIGPKAHVTSYVLRGGEMLNLDLLCADDERTSFGSEVKELQDAFNKWDPLLTRLLAMTSSAMKWKVLMRPPAETWLHEGGKFLMIGDAAHTMMPYLSQGAAVAIEDAAVLGEIFKHTNGNIGIEHLKLYEYIRKKRAEKIIVASEHQRKSYNLADGHQQQQRDESLAGPPKVGDYWQWRDPIFSNWLYGYDYQKDVRDTFATWNY